jgi:16S rRNA U516 pseudouridylate synthase RsuA-like enzyme
MERKVIKVENILEPLRIDKYLSNALKEYSREYIKVLCKSGFVKLNNKVIVEPDKKVYNGDEIEVTIPKREDFINVGQIEGLDIIYEDEDLLVINKPAFVKVHPAKKFDEEITLLDFLLKKFPGFKDNKWPLNRPFLVHRLDKETTGVLLIAKTPKMQFSLSKQFQKREIRKVYRTIVEEAKKVGREYLAIYNVAEDFLNTNFNYIVELVRNEGKPVLLVVYPSGIYYWVINVEYVIIDELNRPREIATWQIDVGNAQRFNIKYVDEKGNEKYPVIVHTAILGSIERYIYMVFDTLAKNERHGVSPTLPLWLSPIQVRIIPVAQEHLDYAIKVAQALLSKGFRVDVDDRNEGLGKKIRDAGIEWIPYVVVIGTHEIKTNTLNVRIRSKGIQKVMPLDELISLLETEVEGYPKVEMAMPMLLSKRPALSYIQQLKSPH